MRQILRWFVTGFFFLLLLALSPACERTFSGLDDSRDNSVPLFIDNTRDGVVDVYLIRDFTAVIAVYEVLPKDKELRFMTPSVTEDTSHFRISTSLEPGEQQVFHTKLFFAEKGDTVDLIIHPDIRQSEVFVR
jgi:hypothetical protein